MNELTNTNNFGATLEVAPKIIANFEMLNAFIEEKSALYEATVYTGDRAEQKKSLKKDRAEINKFVDQLKTAKKTVKEAIMAPYTEFAGEIDKLAERLQIPAEGINKRVLLIEEEERNEKRDDIRAFYETTAFAVEEDFFEPLFKKIFDEKWLNVTTSAKKYKDEITLSVTQYITGRDTLKLMNNKFESEGLSVLRETLSLQDAILHMNELQKKEEEERLRLEQEAQRLVEMEKARLEKEAAEKLEQEKLRLEKEAKLRIENEKEKLRLESEQEKLQKEVEPVVLKPIHSAVNSSVVSSIVSSIPTSTVTPVANENKVSISLNKEDFEEFVKEFLKRNSIRYEIV